MMARLSSWNALAWDSISLTRSIFIITGASRGLGLAVAEQLLAPDRRLRLPMRPGQRSLNLSNAVAVMVSVITTCTWSVPNGVRCTSRLSPSFSKVGAKRAASEAERTALLQEHHQKLLEVTEDCKTQVIQVRRQLADAELAAALAVPVEAVAQAAQEAGADALVGLPDRLALDRIVAFLEDLPDLAVRELLAPDLRPEDVEGLLDGVGSGPVPGPHVLHGGVGEHHTPAEGVEGAVKRGDAGIGFRDRQRYRRFDPDSSFTLRDCRVQADAGIVEPERDHSHCAQPGYARSHGADGGRRHDGPLRRGRDHNGATGLSARRHAAAAGSITTDQTRLHSKSFYAYATPQN